MNAIDSRFQFEEDRSSDHGEFHREVVLATIIIAISFRYKGIHMNASHQRSDPDRSSDKSVRSDPKTELASHDRPVESKTSPSGVPGDTIDGATFQILVEEIPHLIWIADREGLVEYVNPRWNEYTGASPQAALASRWTDFVHPDDRVAAEDRWNKALIAQTDYESEFRLRRGSDGSYRTQIVRARPLKDSAGELTRWIGTCTDIEDQKQNEQSLKSLLKQRDWIADFSRRVIGETDIAELMDEAVERLADLLDVEFTKILELTPDGDRLILRAGRGWRPELIGVASILSHENSQAGYTLPAGGPVIVEDLAAETRFRGPDLLVDHGVKSGISVVINRGDRPFGVLGVHSSRKRIFSEIEGTLLGSVANILGLRIARDHADRAIRAGELRFHAIFTGSLDAILIADDQGRYTDANPAAGELFGVPHQELVGRSIADFSPPGFPFDQVWKEFLRNDSDRGTFDLRRPDGSVREVEFAAKSNIVPGKHLSILRDVTERNRLMKSLASHAERLEILRAIDQSILAALSPSVIASNTIEHLSRLVQFRCIGIFLFHHDTREVSLIAGIGEILHRYPRGERRPLKGFNSGEMEALCLGNTYIHKSSASERSVALDQCESIDRALERDSKIKKQLESVYPLISSPIQYNGLLTGFIRMTLDADAAVEPEQIEVVREVAEMLAVAFRHARLFDEVEEGREQLRLLSRRLIRAQEDERRGIARELHDEIGQALTAVKIAIQTSALEIKTEKGKARMRDAAKLIEQTLGQVRDMSLHLRPAILDDLGLVAALRSHLAALKRTAGLDAEFIYEPVLERFSLEVESACYRIVQESLTNIMRHAGARRAKVELRREGAELILIVADDGKGFDVSRATAQATHGKSLGLLGMKERASLAGGILEIESIPDRGSTIRARFPIEPPT